MWSESLCEAVWGWQGPSIFAGSGDGRDWAALLGLVGHGGSWLRFGFESLRSSAGAKQSASASWHKNSRPSAYTLAPWIFSPRLWAAVSLGTARHPPAAAPPPNPAGGLAPKVRWTPNDISLESPSLGFCIELRIQGQRMLATHPKPHSKLEPGQGWLSGCQAQASQATALSPKQDLRGHGWELGVRTQ